MVETATQVWQPAPGTRHLALLGVYASVAATGIAWGTLVPLMPLLLHRQGFSDTAIGINAAMPILAVLTIGPLLGVVIGKLGLNLALYGGIAVVVLALLALSVPQPFIIGLALRYLIGLGGGLHWILSETWINTCAPPERRGVYVGIYGMLFMMGFVLGPLLVSILDLDSMVPFGVIAGFVALSGIVMWSVRHTLPPVAPETHHAPWQLFTAAPVLYFGVGIAGMTDAAVWAMFPVFALGMGSVAAHSLALTAILNSGTVASQIGIGMLADRLGARIAMLGCATLLTLAACSLPFVFSGSMLWPILFLIGATAGGMYTLPMIEMGERFAGDRLAGANALFVTIYSLGGLIGPPFTGAMMDIVGPLALPAYVAVVGTAFLAIAAPASWRLRRSH